MKITKKEFLNDVMHEINALKEYATPKELAKLNFDEFDYTRSKNCIYGQMTGHCDNKRAEQLMRKSCVRVLNFSDVDNNNTVNLLSGKTFTKIKHFINGPINSYVWDESRTFNFMSALESYIAMKGAKNKQIIQYLRGEVDTLKL